MKTEKTEKFYKNFNTFEDYKKYCQQKTKKFEENERNSKSLSEAVLGVALPGISLGFQIISLKKFFVSAYGILQPILSKEKRTNFTNNNQSKESGSSSPSKNLDESSVNTEFSTSHSKIPNDSLSSEALKVTEVFENKMANSSFDFFKNGLKKALMEARAEAKLDGHGKKSKIHLNELMGRAKDELKKASLKLEEDQALAITLAKEKIEKFIEQADPRLDAKDVTKRLILSTKWSDLESKDCLKEAAGFLQNEIKRNQFIQQPVLAKPPLINSHLLNKERDIEYNYYDNNAEQYPAHFSKQSDEVPLSNNTFPERVQEPVNKAEYHSIGFLLEESNDPNVQRYRLCESARECGDGNFGTFLNRCLAKPEIEKVLTEGRESCKSFEPLSQQKFESLKNATNESSKTFVLDGFNPYDPFH